MKRKPTARDLERVINAFISNADSDANGHATRVYGDAVNDVSVSRFTDTQQQHLIQQVRARGDRIPTQHFAARSVWREHGRRILPDAHPYTLPVAEHRSTRHVYAYTDTVPVPRTDTAVFHAIHPRADIEDSTTPRITELYNATVTAAESGAIPAPNAPIDVEICNAGDLTRLTALGESFNGMVKIRSYLSTAERFRTLVHELAHEHVHQPNTRTNPPARLEVEAEAIAYTVCATFGIPVLQSEQYARVLGQHELPRESDTPVRDVLSGRVPVVRDAAVTLTNAIAAQDDRLSTDLLDV